MEIDASRLYPIHWHGAERGLRNRATFVGFLETLSEIATIDASISINVRPDRPRRCVGMEIFEIQPVMLGGSPTDPANKTVLSRTQHIGAVRYWNMVIQQARRKQANRSGLSS